MQRMPYRVLEDMYDTRDANYAQRCRIVESLPEHVKIERIFLHNTKFGMK